MRAVDEMFDTIAPRYDLLNRILTFGMDVGWRRRTVAALGLPPSSLVLDVGCGTGDLCQTLEATGHRPIGFDRSHGMLARARQRTRSPLVRGDALHLPVRDGAADGLVCGFTLRNLAVLEPFFAECARVLRPGGRVGLLEVAAPSNPVLRWGHSVYFGRVVPLVGGLLSDGAAYRYLPRSVAYLPGPSELSAMLVAAGFLDAERKPLSAGIAQLYVGTRR